MAMTVPATTGIDDSNSVAHSRLGASNAARWISCPGSVQASAALPPLPSGPDAIIGTAAHALGERCLLDGSAAATHVGETIEGVVVDEAMAERVQVYLDEVREAQRAMPHALLLVEQRISLSWLHPAMFGTADAVLVEPWSHVVVIDYKDGANPVNVLGPQLAYYALGVAHEHHAESAECTIVQPRGGGVSSVRYSRAALDDWADRFKRAAEATEKPDAPRVAGDHCRYCPAAATCPELHRHAVTVAQADFAPVIAPPAPHTLTPDQLAMVLRHAQTIEGWLESVKKHANAVASGGVTIPGFKLVEGRRGARQWNDEAAAAAALHALGVDPYERVLLSPAAVEKMSKPAKAALAQVAALITQSPGKPALVPENDKRPAIAAPAAVDFASPHSAT